MSQEELIRLDSEKDYEVLFRKNYSSLCQKVNRIVKNQDLAEDLVQDVFVKLWEKRKELNISTSIEAYAYRAAINSAFNHIRRSYPFVELETNTSDSNQSFVFHSELEHKEVENQIKQLMDYLPEACRAIFILSREDSLSYKEIAETLGISIKTVENQMSKALKILREHVSKIGMLIFMMMGF